MLRQILRPLLLSVCVTLALGYTPTSSAGTAVNSFLFGAPAPLPLMTLQAKTHGFSVGAPTAPNVVYVFFDAQCPHCGHLWDLSQPQVSAGQVRFVWVPVARLNPSSLTQGATLLKTPSAMGEHERLLLNHQHGIAVDATAQASYAPQVQANSELLKTMNPEGVPFLVTQNAKTQALVAQAGVTDLQDLQKFLGL